MRHPTILLALLFSLVSADARAQHVEPHLGRAARRIAQDLVLRLPEKTPVPEALAVAPGWGAARALGAALRRALQEQGFEVVPATSSNATSGVLTLVVSGDRAGDLDRIIVETRERDPLRLVCRYGQARWVDVAEGEEALVFEGPLRSDRRAALEAAREAARRRLVREVGLRGEDTRTQRLLAAFPQRSFIAAVGSESSDVTLYRAWLRVDTDTTTLRRLQHRADMRFRARQREPWFRAAAILGLGVLLGLAYLRLDLRTRGYLTGRLRLLFGTLFFLGAGFCWRVPL